MKTRRTHELRNRGLFTAVILAAYLICRHINLCGVSVATDMVQGEKGQFVIMAFLTGGRYRESVMALGIAPYINASLITYVVLAARNVSSKVIVSKTETNRLVLLITVAIATIMAVTQSFELTFRSSIELLWAYRLVAILEMLGGALLASMLCLQNEKRGIGGSMPVVLVNITGYLIRVMGPNRFYRFPLFLLLCVATILVTTYMENSLIRLPLQKVSIHNVHTDQSYLAYERSPTGIMPVMFASATYFLLCSFAHLLANIFPENRLVAITCSNLVLAKPLGSILFLALVIILSLLSSLLILNPGEIAYQLQRNGDSIVGIYAGKDTKQYIAHLIIKWSFISGVLQTSCFAISFCLSFAEIIPAGLLMIPSSLMILTSIVCGLVREAGVYRRYDAYHFFM